MTTTLRRLLSEGKTIIDGRGLDCGAMGFQFLTNLTGVGLLLNAAKPKVNRARVGVGG